MSRHSITVGDRTVMWFLRPMMTYPPLTHIGMFSFPQMLSNSCLQNGQNVGPIRCFMLIPNETVNQLVSFSMNINQPLLQLRGISETRHDNEKALHIPIRRIWLENLYACVCMTNSAENISGVFVEATR